MSPKTTTIRPSAEPSPSKTPANHTGSDNDCYADLPNRIQIQPAQGRKRAPRAGIAGGRRKRTPMAARLEAMTVKGPGCWMFLGAPTGNNGYSLIAREDGSRVYAHRAAWELANGRPVPDGLRVLHSCDNPRCVNPSHLRVGTQAENIHESIQKGRYNAFGRQKLNAGQVRQIRALAAQGVRHRDIAAQFNIRRHSVSAIVNRRSWGHLDRPFAVGDLVVSGDGSFIHQPPQALDSEPQHGAGALDALHRVFERVPSRPVPVSGEVR